MAALLSKRRKSKKKELVQRDEEIQRIAEKDDMEEAQKIRLLLIGSNDSGKSMLFQTLSTDPHHLRSVCSATIASMKALVKAAENFEVPIEAREAAESIKELPEAAMIDMEAAEQLQTLWKDPGIQRAYERRNEFPFFDKAPYFFRKVDKLADPEYTPSVADALKAGEMKSGVTEIEFVLENVKFVMYDVDGQDNKREKWMPCFDDVNAIVFVAALDEYDQVLHGDSTQNRLVETLNLFDEICNSKSFGKTDIILLLNKRDLFKEKIRSTDIRQPDPADTNRMIFDDYTGGCDYESGVNYILQKFLDQDESDKDMREVCWRTLGRNTDEGKALLRACQEITIKQNLRREGLLS